MKELSDSLRVKLTAWLMYDKEEGPITMKELALKIGVSNQCLYGFIFKKQGLKLKTLQLIKRFVERHYKDHMETLKDDNGTTD
jgi:hypothetical protein